MIFCSYRQLRLSSFLLPKNRQASGDPPEAKLRGRGLFFKCKSVFESLADSLGYFVIAVGIRVESDSVYQRHIDFTVHKDFFIGGDIYDFADYAAAIFVVLIFDELTFQTEGKFVDNRRIYCFGFACSKSAVFKLISCVVAGNNA